MEIEPKVLGFCSWKLSPKYSVFVYGTWAQRTWFSFMEIPTSAFHAHVDNSMEIEPTGLDFHEWSPALHAFHVGPSWDLFSSLPVSLSLFSPHTLSSALTPSLHSLTTFLSSHTTLISQVMFLQYCDYLLGVF